MKHPIKILKTQSHIPSDFLKSLHQKAAVLSKWKSLTPIARRDFIFWIESAKQLETRKRRIVKACDMLMKGKRRPCCFAVVPMNLYQALNDNPRAKDEWKKMSSEERRDLVQWIEAEKTSEKREKRIRDACNMIASHRKDVATRAI